MNAKQMIAKLDGYGGIIPFNSEELDVTLRALRLLAAAEANDGTGCKLIEDLRTEADLCRNETATDIADLLDDAASALIATGAQFNALKDERNGLAARVAELEREGSAADIYGRTAAGHGFINAPKWNELADETKQLYREAAARSKP